MKDWLTRKQEEDAARKAEDAAAIAEFVSAGKVKNLGYADEKYMKKMQRYGYHVNNKHNSERSAKIVAQQEEDDKFCIFSRNDRLKS